MPNKSTQNFKSNLFSLLIIIHSSITSNNSCSCSFIISNIVYFIESAFPFMRKLKSILINFRGNIKNILFKSIKDFICSSNTL